MKPYMNKIVLTAVVLGLVATLAIASYLILYSDEADFKTTDITIINSHGENITVHVELALDSTQHRKGLSGRDYLCNDWGMLFIFRENVSYGFWMKDTSIPLSIAFIAENGTIIDIRDMEPYSTDSHKPNGEYRYALEVNRGLFHDNDIVIGDMVMIPREYSR